MKKLFVGLILVTLIIGTLTSCCFPADTSDSEVSQEGGSAAAAETTGNLGNYYIEIDSCRLANPEYSDKTVVIVKYIFTNYADNAISFSSAIHEEVYQDGIGLNKHYLSIESANYSPDNQSKEIKTGATLEVEVAYELNDLTTPIEVEVEEYFSFKDQKITKTFNIK